MSPSAAPAMTRVCFGLPTYLSGMNILQDFLVYIKGPPGTLKDFLVFQNLECFIGPADCKHCNCNPIKLRKND